MTTIGFATIGQTPRTDLVPYLMDRLGRGVKALEGGVLDGLEEAEIASLDDRDQGLQMVTLLRDGGSARLSYRQALPRMQTVVDDLVAQGANLVVILCGADWSAIKATVPVVNPGVLFPKLIQGLAGNSRLGVVRPAAGQVAATAEQYRNEFGLDAVVTSAFPYDDGAVAAARTAARELGDQGAELLWLTCVGMDEEMREAARTELDVPIVLARSILARVLAELVD